MHGDRAADVRIAATVAGLVYVSDEQAGISRRRGGRHFSHRSTNGNTITDSAERDRVRKFAAPPAYTPFWICVDPRGHIPETGRDAKGRKHYCYNDRFRAVRDATKCGHMLDFAAALPRIRATFDGERRVAVQSVASTLGNTPTIYRKCYIHPEIFDSYQTGSLALEAYNLNGIAAAENLTGLTPVEALVYAFLKHRSATKPVRIAR